MVAGLLLTGCGQTGSGEGSEADGKGDSVSVPSGSPDEATTPASELKIAVNDPSGGPKAWTLTCDPPGGDHPDAAAACKALTAAAQNAFTPVAKDQQCTQIFGGPETATIVGTWKGEPVKATYTRVNGCEIARWKQLEPVFQTST
jgi:Subtilisin inhibitor-like